MSTDTDGLFIIAKCPNCGDDFPTVDPTKWTVNRKVCKKCWAKLSPAFYAAMTEVLSNVERKDVHTEHCCTRHGCKYGDEDCTVTTKVLKQSFPCEDCECWCPCNCGCRDSSLEPIGLCIDCMEGNHELPPSGVIPGIEMLLPLYKSIIEQIEAEIERRKSSDVPTQG